MGRGLGADVAAGAEPCRARRHSADRLAALGAPLRDRTGAARAPAGGRPRPAARHRRHHAQRGGRAHRLRLGGWHRDGAAIGDRCRCAAGVRVSGRRAGAVPDRRPAQQLHPGVSRAAADPGDQRAHQALLSLGHPAMGGAGHRLGAQAHARRIGPCGHVGCRQHLRRHGGGAAAGAAVSRHHEPRRSVRHHDGRHGRRGGHRARDLRHHPPAGAAGRGRAPDRGLRDQRAGSPAALGADGAAGAGEGRHGHASARATPTVSSSTTRPAPAWTPSPRAPGRAWCCSPT